MSHITELRFKPMSSLSSFLINENSEEEEIVCLEIYTTNFTEKSMKVNIEDRMGDEQEEKKQYPAFAVNELQSLKGNIKHMFIQKTVTVTDNFTEPKTTLLILGSSQEKNESLKS